MAGMSNRMRSFALWTPPETAKPRQWNAKAVARLSGALLAVSSVPVFLMGAWTHKTLREIATLREMGVKWFFAISLMAALLLFCGIATYRWGRRP
jgi:hypothetical protein